MSSINYNSNINNSVQNSVQSSVYTSTIDPALFQSVTDQAQLNSIIKNMESDTLDRPIKFAKPKYSEVKKTYEVLAPITNKTIEMPTKHSSKVRTVEAVFQKPIYLDENAGISTIMKGGTQLEDIPLPTTSVINNLIKDSVIQSNINFGNQMQGYNYNTSQLGKTNYEQQLIKEDQIKNSTKIKASQSNYNNNIINQSSKQSQYSHHSQYGQNNNPVQSVHQSKYNQTKYNQSKYNQSNIPQTNQKISEIPQPDVQVGEGLKYSNNSNIKSTMNNQSKLSNINNNVSVHPSKVHQSNMPQAQQSVHSTKYSKQSQYNNQKISEIPQPDVQEGEGLMYSTHVANNSVHPSKVHQSNMPQPQQSVHSTKYSKQSQYNNQKISEIPQPDVQEGEGLMYSTQIANNNASVHPSKVHQSNMSQAHQSVHSTKYSKQSQYNNQKISEIPQPDVQVGEGLMYSTQFAKSNIKSTMNNNNNQSAMKNSLPSYHESQIKKSNNNASNIKKNPIGVYETTLMPSTIQSNINNNSSINNNTNNIKKNPIGVYETTLMPSTIQSNINNNSSINNNSLKKNIDNNFSKYNSKISNGKAINKNPIGVYETTLMPSTIQNNINNNNNYNYNLNNNLVPSVHVTKVKESNISKMSVEPKPGEYNIMNNKTTMGDYSNPSFPTQSNIGKNMGKSENPPNPFK